MFSNKNAGKINPSYKQNILLSYHLDQNVQVNIFVTKIESCKVIPKFKKNLQIFL